MELDLSTSVDMEKRTGNLINNQTILKTPEKPPSPIYNYRQNHVTTVLLAGVPIVCLFIDGKERLCLAQISNTLLKSFSYNEIHNRRVALGITCVQCTPVQLEILRRAGAMPISSRRCGMITKREAERLVKSFLEDNLPPKLPENFHFEVEHNCGWGCRGRFEPSRYNSSRAKCIKCTLCNLFFSPNKFIFHFHRTPESKYNHPDAANFNSWRRHLGLVAGTDSEDIMHAWEDVKAMFNGGSRKRMVSGSSAFRQSPSASSEPKKPKLHLESSGISSKSSFPSQYPNYPMFSVPGKAYPFTPLAAHNQLGLTFPFSKESSHQEVAKQTHAHGFGHTPWRSPSNFIFPSYDLLWANHFNMANMNTPLTSFRPNMYQTPTVKDLSLFSEDRHSPTDSANSTEDDDSQMSPVASNINNNFSQNNERLSAFKPVLKADMLRNERMSNETETSIHTEDKAETVDNSDIDIDDESSDIKDTSETSDHDVLEDTAGLNLKHKPHLNVDKYKSVEKDSIDSDQRRLPMLDDSGVVENKNENSLHHSHRYDNNNDETKDGNVEHLEKEKDSTSSMEFNISPSTETKETQDTGPQNDESSETGTVEQVEQTINRLQGSLQDKGELDQCQQDAIYQQLQILKEALCSELEQERKMRVSMQHKLKEAHDALQTFSSKILGSRPCTDLKLNDTASTIQR